MIKFDQRNSLAAKSIAFFTAIMAFFYLFEGLYFLVLGIQKAFWQAGFLGAMLVFYGSFRSFRTFQKYRHKKKQQDNPSSLLAGSRKKPLGLQRLLSNETGGAVARF